MVYFHGSTGPLVPLLLTPGTTLGHGGRIDFSGGHRDNKNKSGLGSYHYHCDGYSAHLHKNEVCLYKKSSTKKVTLTSKTNTKSAGIKKAQQKLNQHWL